MERTIFRSSFLTFLILFFISALSFAQDVTGIWRGYFISAGGEQYKLEFQVEQKPAAAVTGVSYSYLSTVFYGKATMTGLFKKQQQNLLIQEIRTVEVRMSSFSVACIMNYNLTYTRSGKEEFLEGSYTSKYEKDDTIMGVRRGRNCGGGTVYLRKVPTSDFYTEPFLRDKPKTDTNSQRPRPNPPVVKNNPVRNNKPVVVNKPKKDSTKTTTTVPEIKPPVTQKNTATPNVLKTRENALAQVINVHTDEIMVKLYDNGEIDGDTISIYVDKKLALSNRRLSASALSLPLKFEENGEEHEVIMVAENLGRIPPNTSLMVITAGDKRYQVQITSTEQKNAMVRFKYVKP